ncbi:hypothetical protein ACPEIF_11425 [Streptomyces sp. NPDC012600]|uniref:hypothetical protein n=1 Tax=Streptomyces sp. NPDC012600 TaxID=3415005 RepID=UPI003C2B8C63
MRIPRRLAPVVLLGVLALAGCGGGGTQADGSNPAPPPTATDTATATASVSPSPTEAPAETPAVTVSATPDPVMPALHSRTYEDARAELTRQDISTARLTAAARHKDVTLPRDHDDWYICATTPRPGAVLTAATTVTVRLAEDFSDCTTSFHGYLHQKNDPAYTPPAPKPKPVPTTQAPAPAPPAGTSMTTCPDGKQGYACTSNGHPVVDGQFCPKADRGRTLKATNGTMVTCSYDPSVTPYRWQ